MTFRKQKTPNEHCRRRVFIANKSQWKWVSQDALEPHPALNFSLYTWFLIRKSVKLHCKIQQLPYGMNVCPPSPQTQTHKHTHTHRHKQGLLTPWQTRNWKQDSQGKAFKGPILVLTSDVHAHLLCTSSRTQSHKENPECLGESSTK